MVHGSLSPVTTTIPNMNPKSIGEISEAVVLAHLVKAGHVVLMPFGDNQRYDFVIDRGVDGFERVQVKTGRLTSGVVRFKCSSVNGFTGLRTTYDGQADTFMVYCPENDTVYAVPVSECGTSGVSLRVDAPLGGTRSNIRMASDYLA